MENPNGISPVKVVFNMLNQIIGIGIICYHVNYFKVGILPCVLASIAYGYMTSFAAHLLIKSSLKTNKQAWGDIVMELFGTMQFLIFNCILVFACIVFGSSYLTAAAQWITCCLPIDWNKIRLNKPGTNDPSALAESIVLILTSTVSLFAAMVKNLDKFAKISILSNAIAMGTIVIIIIMTILEPGFSNGARSAKLVEDVSKIPETIGILATTYVYAQIALQLFYSLKRPSLSTWHKSEFIGMTLVITLNIITGMLGYFAWSGTGLKVNANILQNFGSANIAICICRVGYAVSILLTFPMQMLSGRKSAAFVYNYWLGRSLDEELSGLEFRSITVLIWAVAAGVGVCGCFGGLDSILSVGGCFVGAYMGFVLPAACYLWSTKSKKTSETLEKMEMVITSETKEDNGEATLQEEMGDCERKNDGQEEDDTLVEQIGAWMMFILGFILMFGATGISIYSEIKKRRQTTS